MIERLSNVLSCRGSSRPAETGNRGRCGCADGISDALLSGLPNSCYTLHTRHILGDLCDVESLRGEQHNFERLYKPCVLLLSESAMAPNPVVLYHLSQWSAAASDYC